MLSKIVASLLLLSLVSCGNLEYSGPQCSPVFKYETVSEKEVISLEESYCICGNYEFTRDHVGPVGGSWKEPIKSCNKVIGWKPKEYAKVSSFWLDVWEEIREALENHGY